MRALKQLLEIVTGKLKKAEKKGIFGQGMRIWPSLEREAGHECSREEQ